MTKEKLVHSNRFHLENLCDLKSCPDYPIITFKERGRLGNQMSSYANVLALSWQFGYNLHLPPNIKRNIEEIFENVTFPTVDGDYLGDDKCKAAYVIEDIEPFIEKLFNCDIENQELCLPSAFERTLNLKIIKNHNVRMDTFKMQD